MSIIGDGLMGALSIGSGYLREGIKEEAETRKADATMERQEATDIRRDDLAQARQLATMQLKEEFDRRNDTEKRVRLQNEGDAIDQETDKIDLKRSSGLINSIRNSVPNEGEFANKELGPEDIETIRSNMSPADAEKHYGIKPRTALSIADDQIAAAKNVGAFNSRPALIEQRKTLFETDKAERADRQKSDELKRKTAKDDADNAIKQQREETRERDTATKERRNEIMMSKIASSIASAGRGNTDFDKKVTLLREAGASKEEIASFITEKKQPSIQDLAASFMKADPFSTTPEVAVKKAQELQKLTSSQPAKENKAPTPTAPASKAEYDKLPKGSVFTAPDGTRRIKP